MDSSRHKFPRRQPRPAEGERNAIRGYSAQYRIAAELIYGALVEGDLHWIRVADPNAGRVDDIQIGRAARVDAYQVKWGEYEERATFDSLISASGTGANREPSLLAQLADGWDRLTRLEAGRVVHVHLVMRASPSHRDNIDGSGRHLQMFLRHAWAFRATWGNDGSTVEAEWSSAIATLRKATGLDADAFLRFVQCAHLDLGFRLGNTDPWDRASRRRDVDIEHLAHLIFQLVADEGRPVEITRAELVSRLGWVRRLDLRFRHEFPVDERLYRPIQRTVSEIEAALQIFQSGYLALMGTPGSGKSTTLTQMLRYRPGYRVVRYYAFVRGDTAQGRGEAESFLADVTLAIRHLGVPVVGNAATLPDTRAELADLFGRQLAALHDDWQASGVKTVILVDGLDHVERERQPEHSLMDVLPSPGDVPDRVLLVLGSQPVGLSVLTPRIRSQLEQSGRTLTMDRLERRQVVDIAVSSLSGGGIAGFDPEVLWRLSAGHPLALAYLLKRLTLTSDAHDRRTLIESAQPFGGEIEEEYRTHWNALRDDAEVRDLLGLLCRLRGSVDLDVLASLTTEPVLERFVEGAAHLFHQETASRWTFFHNSFRQFLLVVTGRNALGRSDTARHALYHRRLAETCVASPGTPLAWERIHHLEGAGDNRAILGLFTQAYFREQFMALRPLKEISEDIATCLRAAAAAPGWRRSQPTRATSTR